MSYMFYDCSNLKNINTSKFDTKNAISMRSIFAGCENLKNVDSIFSFNLEKIHDIKIDEFKNLNDLILSSFNNITDCYIVTISYYYGYFNKIKLSSDFKDIINYASGYVLDFISIIKTKNKENYLFNRN